MTCTSSKAGSKPQKSGRRALITASVTAVAGLATHSVLRAATTGTLSDGTSSGQAADEPPEGNLQLSDRERDRLRAVPFSDQGWRTRQAPFGGEVSPAIANYNRVSPYLANAGLLLAGGLQQSLRLGFRLVIDLRAPEERGVQSEQALAGELGIAWRNIPVSSEAPGRDQITEFAALIHQPEHYPVLVHCVTSNRSGALWALYRARMGVPPLIAVEEGRAAGLESREAAVRRQLGLAEL